MCLALAPLLLGLAVELECEREWERGKRGNEERWVQGWLAVVCLVGGVPRGNTNCYA